MGVVTLYIPKGGFGWTVGNVTTFGSGNQLGNAITLGTSNAKGSYVTLLSAATVANNVFGIWLCFNAGGVPATVRDILVDIGIDPAGGTSFTVVIPNLLCSSASGAPFGPPIFYFPLFIPAGSTIGARASVNNATAGAIYCWVKVFGQPDKIDAVQVGTIVKDYGVTTGSSNGTIITSGSAGAKGSYASLGATSYDHWYWQTGFGINDTTMAGNVYFCDLAFGDASNKNIIIPDMLVHCDANEDVHCMSFSCGPPLKRVASGATLYARMACTGTPDTTLSMAAYGLGG